MSELTTFHKNGKFPFVFSFSFFFCIPWTWDFTVFTVTVFSLLRIFKIVVRLVFQYTLGIENKANLLLKYFDVYWVKASTVKLHTLEQIQQLPHEKFPPDKKGLRVFYFFTINFLTISYHLRYYFEVFHTIRSPRLSVDLSHLAYQFTLLSCFKIHVLPKWWPRRLRPITKQTPMIDHVPAKHVAWGAAGAQYRPFAGIGHKSVCLFFPMRLGRKRSSAKSV